MDELIERYTQYPQKQRYAAIAVAAVVLLGGYYTLFYSDNAARLETLESQYQSLERERTQQRGFLDNLAKYEARLNELQQSLAAARAQLPDEADVPQLLAQLGNKGRQTGVGLQNFKPKGDKNHGFYSEIAFDMDIEGSYHEVATFIDSIGKLDRIVNVGNLSMTQPKTVNQKVVVKGALTVKTYRFLSDAEQAAENAKDKGKGKKK